MGKLSQFEIKFGNPRRTYRPGDTVTGSLIVDTPEPQHKTRIQVKFKGKTKVHFSRNSGGKRRNHYFGSETYFERAANLWPGTENDHASQLLQQGRHEFPFTFTLPTDIPSSFHCYAGNISYSVKATFSTRGKNFPVSIKEFFAVYKALNLNDCVHSMNPREYEAEKTLCCLCCASGNVSAKVSMLKDGFVHGEKIPLQAKVYNNSESNITSVYFTLEQVSRCYAMGKIEEATKELKNVVPVKHDEGIAPGASDTWTGEESITVPVAIPTGLDGCFMIDLNYNLVMYVVPSGLSCSLRLAIPVVIGTYSHTYSQNREAGNRKVSWLHTDFRRPRREVAELSRRNLHQTEVHSQNRVCGQSFDSAV